MSVTNFFPGKSFGYLQIPAVTVNAGVNIATHLAANLANFTVTGGPWKIYLTPEAQGFRWRDDATAATAAVGAPVSVGQMLTYDGDSLANLTVFSQVAGCILNVYVERQRPTGA